MCVRGAAARRKSFTSPLTTPQRGVRWESGYREEREGECGERREGGRERGTEGGRERASERERSQPLKNVIHKMQATQTTHPPHTRFSPQAAHPPSLIGLSTHTRVFSDAGFFPTFSLPFSGFAPWL